MRLALFCTLITALVVSGCSNADPNQQLTATGVVSLDGTPLPAAVILLESTIDQEVRSGQVSKDGNFRIPEVKPGTYKVAVRTSQFQSTVKAPKPIPGGLPVATGVIEVPYVAIPKKYESLGTSGLEFEISAENDSITIDLSSS